MLWRGLSPLVILRMMFPGKLTLGRASHGKQALEKGQTEWFKNVDGSTTEASRYFAQKRETRALPWSQAWGWSLVSCVWWLSLGSWSLAGPSLKKHLKATATWTHYLWVGPSRLDAEQAGRQVRGISVHVDSWQHGLAFMHCKISN